MRTGWRPEQNRAGAAGSMTVFFCLILLLISALICVCLESARLAGLRYMARVAAGSAVQSVFADYEERMWEDYGVFFHYAPFGLDVEAEEYLEYYVNPGRDLYGLPDYTDFWGLSAEGAETADSRTALSDGGRAFLEQAAEYEKYRIGGEAVNALLERAGLLDGAKKLRAFAVRLNGYFGKIQSVCTLYQEIRDGAAKLSELTARLRERISGGEADAEPLREGLGAMLGQCAGLRTRLEEYRRDTGEIGAFAEELRGEYGEEEEVYREQIEQIEELAAPGGTGEAAGEVSAGLGGLWETLSALQAEAAAAVDAGTAENIGELSERISEALEEADRLAGQICAEEDSAEDGEPSAEEGGAESLESGAEAEDGAEDAEQSAAGWIGKAILEQVKQWKNMGVLSLVMGEKSEDIGTDYLTDPDSLPSAKISAMTEQATAAEKGLLVLYTGDCFPDGISGETGEEQRFSCQREYILFGHRDSRSNLSAMAELLLAVREGLNLAYLLTDTQRKSEARAAAEALAGWSGIRPLVILTEFILLSAWAFAEAVQDVRALFRGEKEPLWKTAAGWKTAVGNVPAGAGESKGLRISYSDYLSLFLLAEKTETVCARCMDMIQEELGGWMGFSLEDCYASAEITVCFSAPFRLITLPLIGTVFGNGYTIRVTSAYAYP